MRKGKLHRVGEGHGKLYRFWCGFWFGHDRESVHTFQDHCSRCGAPLDWNLDLDF